MREMHPTNERLVDYLHGELPAREDADVHEHLASCLPCSQARESETNLTELLRAHAKAEERELPTSLKLNIQEAIERERSSGLQRRIAAAFRPMIAVPAAAVVALALYFAATASHGVHAPARIDARYYVENHAALDATTPFAQETALPSVLTSDTVATDQQPVDETR